MPKEQLVRDPYRRCEERCRHDLGRGLSIAELLDLEPPDSPPVSPASSNPVGPKGAKGPKS